MSHKPSKYQLAIYDFVENGRGNGFVNAVAGSGKTYTLIQCAERIKGEGRFCAFNKHIAEELQGKLDGTTMRAKTIHSIGYAALRDLDGYGSTKLEGRKYHKIVFGLIDGIVKDGRFDGQRIEWRDRQVFREENPWPDLVKMCNLMRLNLIDSDDADGVDRIAQHHGMVFNHVVYQYLPAFMRLMMQEGLRIARYEIDYTDMLWAPCVLNADPEKFPWVFVDEAQDLNRAQLEIVRRSVAPGGRVLFVGDPHQAIYGFAGADNRSVERIISTMKCKLLPLSVCYRCPHDVLELAREYVPQIEDAPGAAAGSVSALKHEEVVASAREGDLILCRTTAPLLEMCYKLIGSGISAAVKGRDIGKGLVAILTELDKRSGGDFERFSDVLREYESHERDKLLRRAGDVESQLEALADRVECVSLIRAVADVNSYAALSRTIESLFASDRPSVMLSTIHRAKGLENGRVFILRPDLMPHPMAKQDWSKEQERNLIYVAYTRAMEALVFVNGGR